MLAANLHHLNNVLEEYLLITGIPLQWNQSHSEQINEQKGKDFSSTENIYKFFTHKT